MLEQKEMGARLISRSGSAAAFTGTTKALYVLIGRKLFQKIRKQISFKYLKFFIRGYIGFFWDTVFGQKYLFFRGFSVVV